MFKAHYLGSMAHAAALWEVYVAPKPGLVDRFGPGAHKDMDHGTFIRSAVALAPFWKSQAFQGLEGLNPKEAFPRLRQKGIVMEKAMFGATGNINTHKGLIFIMSLLLYGAGKLLEEGQTMDAREICRLGGACVEGLAHRDLEPLKKTRPRRELTHGEKLYLRHGITGVRGEAERGFPGITVQGFPALQHALAQGHSLHDSGLYALLHIMLSCEDSTVIHRGGYAFWQHYYRKGIEKALAWGAPFSPRGRRALQKLDQDFSQRRISPGGAADLLSATFFLHFCQNTKKEILQG